MQKSNTPDTATIDCLLVGYNDFDFDENLRIVEAAGHDSGAFRDARLSCIEYKSRFRRPLDILSLFHAQGHDDAPVTFHDMDFMWPTILHLGTFLNRNGFSFDYINLFKSQTSQLKSKLQNKRVLSVAITTTLYVNPRPIIEIVEFIRRHAPRVRIIVGGPYVSSQSRGLPNDDFALLLKYIGADYYVISGEGEAALAQLLTTLNAGTPCDNVPNLAYFVDDSFVKTPTVVEQNDLTDAQVDYSLFDKDQIGEFLSLGTAKSCPFACAYCGFPQRAGKYRYLDVEHIESQLDRIRDLETVTTLSFYDDTFNVPKERFRQILQLMIRKRYDFKWNCYFRSDHATPEIIELMAKAGCEGVFMGIESGSDKMLALMNKTSRSHHYHAAIPRLKAVGILAHANFIIGFPGETRSTFEETLAFIAESQPDSYLAQLWFCDPVTPIWKRREELGIEGSAFNWRHRTMDHRQACDLVEEMFVRVEDSVWAPQWGMSPWAFYYLERKGMTRQQVMSFMRCFNACVKYQLQHPEATEINHELLMALQSSCQFPLNSPAKPLSAVDDVDEFLQCMRTLDVQLHATDDTLRCSFPDDRHSTSLRTEISSRKHEIIQALT